MKQSMRKDRKRVPALVGGIACAVFVALVCAGVCGSYVPDLVRDAPAKAIEAVGIAGDTDAKVGASTKDAQSIGEASSPASATTTRTGGANSEAQTNSSSATQKTIPSAACKAERPFVIPEGADYVRDSVLVSVDGDALTAQGEEALAGYDFTTVKKDTFHYISEGLAEISLEPGATVEDAVNELKTLDVVKDAQPDYLYTIDGLANTQKPVTAQGEEVTSVPAIVDVAEESTQQSASDDAADVAKPQEERVAAADDEAPSESQAETQNVHAAQSLVVAPAHADENAAAGKAEEETQVAEAANVVNDPYFSLQWALKSINAPEVWQMGVKADHSVAVAVFDTGFDVNHEDLADVIPEGAPYNAFYASRADPDESKISDVAPSEQNVDHGMHVAGIIAANANNGKGIAGVSYNANIIPVRVFNYESSVSAPSSALVKAFDHVMDVQDEYNIRVINISTGSKVKQLSDSVLLQKIDEAFSKGIITVCSAGNAGIANPAPFAHTSGDYATAVSTIYLDNSKLRSSELMGGMSSVTCSDPNAVQLGEFTNYNVGTEMAKNISAPGQAILSSSITKTKVIASPLDYIRSKDNEQYMLMSGSSMASPQVAGVLALMYARRPDVPKTAEGAQYMVDALYSSARQLTSNDFDQKYGFGALDALAAVNAVSVDRLSGPSYARVGQEEIAYAVGSQSGWQFSSSNSSVLKVSADGTSCTAVAPGDVVVTATKGGQKQRKGVTIVGDVEGPTYVALSSTAEFAVRQPHFLAWTWHKDTEEGSKELSTGKIVAPDRAGVVSVVADLRTGGMGSGVSCSKTVYAIGPLTGGESLAASATEQLGVDMPEGAGLSTTDFSWSSSDEQVATVDASGVVTGIREGEVTITAKLKESVQAKNDVSYSMAMAITAASAPEEPAVPEITFIDVSENTAHSEDIAWLANKGISEGWKNGDGTREFRPAESVRRADMAAFLYRLADGWGLVKDEWQPKDTEAFCDVTEETAHAREIWWLAENGISAGWDIEGAKKEFRPYIPVARADMAAFLHRLAKLRELKAVGPDVAFTDVNDDTAHAEDIAWLARAGVTKGWNMADDTVEFRPYIDVARQDMAAFLHRLDGLK